MQTRCWFTLLLAAAITIPAGAAQRAWLPPAVERGVAEQFLERLAAVMGKAPDNPERALAGATGGVRALADQLDARGEAWVAELAPDIGWLGIASTGNDLLDQMAALQACVALLYVQFEDPASADDLNLRMTAATGMTALLMAQIYLRQPYVAAGGDVQRIEDTLSGDLLAPVLEAIQAGGEPRARMEAECSPAVVELAPVLVPPTGPGGADS